MSKANNLDRMGWTGDDPLTFYNEDGTEFMTIGEVPERVKKMLADKERFERVDAVVHNLRQRRIDDTIKKLGDKK